MQSFKWYVRRFRSMGGTEIAWRIVGLVRDQVDLLRIPLGLTPKLQYDLSRSFGGFLPGYSCSPVSRETWSADAAGYSEHWRSRLLSQAENILQNRLTYFDLVNADHGDPFNWHRDHSARKDAPIKLSLFTDYRNFPIYGDCKLVWEPNRHHQFVVLARAYVVSGDIRFAQKVSELMRSWIDANPFGYGMNWRSPLEIGVRIINWVWALDLIRPSNVIGDQLWRDIQQVMYLSLWECQRKFSRGSSANNHLLGEAAGVFVGASYFCHLPNSTRWASKAKQVLEREIIRQTYSDGCSREHTFGYMFFVTQFFLVCKLAGISSKNQFSESFDERLLQMYRFLANVTGDAARPPSIGDSDDGYVLDLGDLPHHARELVTVGAIAFEDEALQLKDDVETRFWLFGRSRIFEVRDVAQRYESTAFHESGYFVLRSNRVCILFDAAKLGYGQIAAHGHADCLSFTMSLDGVPVFVDSGTYDYFTFPEWRAHFRSTKAHNTAEIDNVCQSEMQGPFLWGKRAVPSEIGWSSSSVETSIEAEHDGYARLRDPVIHRRRMVLGTETNEVVIEDELVCHDAHQVVVYFHLAPSVAVELTAKNEARLSLNEGRLILRCDDGTLSLASHGENDKCSWVSSAYHTKVRAECIKLNLKIAGYASVKTVISIVD